MKAESACSRRGRHCAFLTSADDAKDLDLVTLESNRSVAVANAWKRLHESQNKHKLIRFSIHSGVTCFWGGAVFLIFFCYMFRSGINRFGFRCFCSLSSFDGASAAKRLKVRTPIKNVKADWPTLPVTMWSQRRGRSDKSFHPKKGSQTDSVLDGEKLRRLC